MSHPLSVPSLSPQAFLKKAEQASLPIADVRSPGEYQEGHIPGAVNLPMFDDEERKEVGIIYKKEGREAAIRKGLAIVGPNMLSYLDQAQALAQGGPLLLHCWRGGMRSGSMAWLFQTAGLEVATLAGGYKAYRQHQHAFFQQAWDLRVVGGATGTGKTAILKALREQGEQVLDLEALARHKGSAFGSIGQAKQPTVKQFENDMSQALSQLDPSSVVWIEDESHAIGRVYIPVPFWHQMLAAQFFLLELPKPQRMARLLREYGSADKKALKEAMGNIQKRLGGLAHQQAIQSLDEGDVSSAAELALVYYDKAYQHGVSKRNPDSLTRVPLTQDDPKHTAQLLRSLIS
ncbi:MAG: tRNA 2-selenouridine(34) synthase MnmH [Bacteroidota bacterium]